MINPINISKAEICKLRPILLDKKKLLGIPRTRLLKVKAQEDIITILVLIEYVAAVCSFFQNIINNISCNF